ncbi:hypothetical protein [Paraburkholderia sp. HD33-4]|uniref:hypothetical protein n=1 Tax=Paraburkholderia sp. HD33-4 TaxID=2883242 RepID=UPI001F28ED8A|nr:hypothetical protein [Paraburkholderia sp. HD33-4]
MNRAFRLLAASFVVLDVVAAANVANAATHDEQAHACRHDAFHFCAAEIPNRAKIIACMERHLNELSPACRAMFGNGQNGDKSNGKNGDKNRDQNGGQ